jgi:hypothetical protein
MAAIVRMLKLKYRLNLIVFILISILLTFICEKVPNRIYDYKKWMFRERKWERGGRIYEYLFRVKLWKGRLPDISDFLKWRFSKKHLAELNGQYLYIFITESCRAEFTHWMIILSTTLFGFWADTLNVFAIFLTACVLNLPYIIIQRYNRPRLLNLLKKSGMGGYALAAAKI